MDRGSPSEPHKKPRRGAWRGVVLKFTPSVACRKGKSKGRALGEPVVFALCHSQLGTKTLPARDRPLERDHQSVPVSVPPHIVYLSLAFV